MLCLKTSCGQTEYRFDKPEFLAKGPKTVSLVPERNRWSSGGKIWINSELSSKKHSIPQKTPLDAWNTVLTTMPIKFSQNPKNSPTVKRKLRNNKKPKKSKFSTIGPLNLLNAVSRVVVKLYTQVFEKFSLKVRFQSWKSSSKTPQKVPWTRRRQFWEPRVKTIDKIRKKNCRNFSKAKRSLLTFPADTLKAALTNSTGFFLTKVLKTIVEWPNLTNK